MVYVLPQPQRVEDRVLNINPPVAVAALRALI
jgi:hypothetical protein